MQMTFKDGALEVKGLVGALVGPPWSKRQNGWHFKEHNGLSVYYEPHASHDLKSVQSVAPVDIAIVPTQSAYAAGALCCYPHFFASACDLNVPSAKVMKVALHCLSTTSVLFHCQHWLTSGVHFAAARLLVCRVCHCRRCGRGARSAQNAQAQGRHPTHQQQCRV